MIATVTLNAAIDKAYEMERPIEGGTVMRVRAVQNTAGGKGLNVARVAKTCNASVKALGIVGGNNGRYLEELAMAEGLTIDFFHAEGETRCCINILDPQFHSTELLEPGLTVSDEALTMFLSDFPEKIRDASVVTFSGSAPLGMPKDIYRHLVLIAKDRGAKVILDSSGDYLKEALDAAPTMIKPNRDEIEMLTGTAPKLPEELVSTAKALNDRGIPWVVISLGGDGALLSCNEGVFIGKPPQIAPVNTVGCGDAMVGAFAVAMERGDAPEDALRFAVAVSAAAAMSPTTGHFAPETFEKIRNDVVIKKNQ